MEDERILVFSNYNTLNYWFKYIINFLKDDNIKCRVHTFNKEIMINNIKLIFIPQYKKIGTMMGSLEKDFIETLKEILSKK